MPTPYTQISPMLLRSQLDFTISHLNIHGLDNNFGYKIPDLEKILINDINILTETWSCTHDKNIPNFLTIELPPNKLDKRKTGRSSGVTFIYYKQYLQNQIKIIKSHKNYLWLEIDKRVSCYAISALFVEHHLFPSDVLKIKKHICRNVRNHTLIHL